jgi:hypothetical protein
MSNGSEIHNLDLDGAVDAVQRRIAAGRAGVAGLSALRAASTQVIRAAVTQAKVGWLREFVD